MRLLFIFAFIGISVIGCNKSNFDKKSVNTNSLVLGGKLLTKPSNHKLGTLLGGPGKTKVIETELINSGRRPLRIYDVIVSCDCTSTRVFKKDLDPGESTILQAELKIGETLGPKGSSISIRSSDETGFPQIINFEWETDNALKSESNTYIFSDIPQGKAFDFNIPIMSSYIVLCKECQFDIANIPDVLKTEFLIKTEQINQVHQINNKKEKDIELGKIHAEILPQAEDQHYHANVLLELRCREEILARLSIPLRWTYDRPILAAPASLSLGIQKPGEIVRKEIFLKGSKNRSFRVQSVTSSEINLISGLEYPHDTVSNAFLSFAIRVPKSKGPWRESLLIKMDSSEVDEIIIPVSGIVED